MQPPLNHHDKPEDFPAFHHGRLTSNTRRSFTTKGGEFGANLQRTAANDQRPGGRPWGMSQQESETIGKTMGKASENGENHGKTIGKW